MVELAGASPRSGQLAKRFPLQLRKVHMDAPRPCDGCCEASSRAVLIFLQLAKGHCFVARQNLVWLLMECRSRGLTRTTNTIQFWSGSGPQIWSGSFWGLVQEGPRHVPAKSVGFRLATIITRLQEGPVRVPWMAAVSQLYRAPLLHDILCRSQCSGSFGLRVAVALG